MAETRDSTIIEDLRREVSMSVQIGFMVREIESALLGNEAVPDTDGNPMADDNVAALVNWFRMEQSDTVATLKRVLTRLRHEPKVVDMQAAVGGIAAGLSR